MKNKNKIKDDETYGIINSLRDFQGLENITDEQENTINAIINLTATKYVTAFCQGVLFPKDDTATLRDRMLKTHLESYLEYDSCAKILESRRLDSNDEL